jgi:hypothetical protein
MEIDQLEVPNGDKLYNSKYKKITFIGQGAYGKISLVQDTVSDSGRYFAMKKFYGEQQRSYYNVRLISHVN